MNLHNDSKIFEVTLKAVSQHLSIKREFVEKDYWISLILKRLSSSKYNSQAVFKGGTSLSKAHKLIDRFSEDVDLAIINTTKTGNEIKNIIRNIEKEITTDLTEINTEGVTSKGSRFRKSVFAYPGFEKDNSKSIIIEINSFANPFPYQTQKITSFVYDFLLQTNNINYIEQYELHPIEINVLNKEQTLIEKLVSLIRFSFDENPVLTISGKIRHFYDLYFLVKDNECAEFIKTKEFIEQLALILKHDRELFEEPRAWQTKSLAESPLINNFENLWTLLVKQYETELAVYAYRQIPDEKDVAKVFKTLINAIKDKVD